MTAERTLRPETKERIKTAVREAMENGNLTPFNTLNLTPFNTLETEPSGEVCVVNPETGGMKGSKPCQLGAAPPEALEALGRVYGYGASKYERNNFRKGYALSLTIDALYRHLLRFLAGENDDPESGESHMAHVAWHALNAIQLLIEHPELDDRWKPDTST